MDKPTVRAIARALNGILLDLMIDGKIDAPAAAVRTLREAADTIERNNPVS